jgi:hypothetical protein
VVVTEEEVALEVEHGPRRVRVCEERVLASCLLGNRDRRGEGRGTEGKSKAERGVGGWKSGACGAQMRRSASAKYVQSAMVAKVQWACAEEQGEEEGWAMRTRIMKGDANRVVEREGANEKTADKKRSWGMRWRDEGGYRKVRGCARRNKEERARKSEWSEPV